MLCRDFVEQGGCLRSDCRYAHGRNELCTPEHFNVPGYKAHFCTRHLLADLQCDKDFQDCFDAHCPLDLRPDLPSVPPELQGTSFTYSDSHVHLDEVLLARRYGSLWMHKRM